MDESLKYRGKFERQRRNLMIVCVLLIIYVVLDLNLNTISILGNSFSLNNSDNVELLIWVLFSYFLVRYYQFYKVVNNSEFLTVFNTSMHKYVPIVAFNNFKKSDIDNLKKANPDGNDFKYGLDSSTVQGSYDQVWHLRISGTRTWRLDRGAGTQRFEDYECVVESNQLIWPKIKSHYNVYIQTPHITEYLLPFILSAATIITKVYYS